MVVEEAAAVVVAARVVAVVAGRAGWAVALLPDRAVVAFAPVVGIESRTWWASRVIRKSALSVARR